MVSSTLVIAVLVAAGYPVDSPAAIAGGSLGLWVGFLGGPLVASAVLGEGRPVQEFGLHLTWRDVPLGLVGGVLAQLVAVPAVTWPFQQLLGGDVSQSARELLAPGPGRWVVIAVVVIGAPVAEELFFRGLLLRSLARHLSTGWAVTTSAALFGATHFQVLAFPGLFTAGLVFALLTGTTGRLGPAIVAHAAFNATTVVLLTATGLGA